MDGWMNKWTDGQTDGWACVGREWMGRWLCRWMDRWTDERVNGQVMNGGIWRDFLIN